MRAFVFIVKWPDTQPETILPVDIGYFKCLKIDFPIVWCLSFSDYWYLKNNAENLRLFKLVKT